MALIRHGYYHGNVRCMNMMHFSVTNAANIVFQNMGLYLLQLVLHIRKRRQIGLFWALHPIRVGRNPWIGLLRQ